MHPLIVPILFLVSGLAGTILLYHEIETGERERLSLETGITAEQVRLRLESWVDARAAMLKHLGDGQFLDQTDLDSHFGSDAHGLLALYPGVQALNFVDRQWVIRQVVPAETNLGALGADLHRHPNADVTGALQQSTDERRIVSTPLVKLLQGGTGFASYYPIIDRSGEWLGYVNCVFRVSTLVETCLHEQILHERFSISLVDTDGDVAYARATAGEEVDPQWIISVPLRMIDRDWQLRLAPTRSHLARSLPRTDELMAVAGSLLFLGLAFLLRAFLLRQEALRRSQEQYRLLVENQIDLVVKFDITGRLLYVSPSFCQALGRDESDLIGRRLLPLIHPDDRDMVKETIAGILRPPHRVQAEFRVPVGETVTWQAWSCAAVLAESGAIEAATAVGRDVSRRRDLEAQLARSRNLRAVGQLAGGIAHEFNNLLQSMLGNVQFVIQDVQPVGQTAADLHEIEKSIGKAIGLTGQLLAFGRRQELTSTRQDLNLPVADSVTRFRRDLRPGVKIVFEPASNPMMVALDSEPIDQIVQTLCDNARDAVGQSGTITVSTSLHVMTAELCLHHAGLRPGDYAAIVVEDTGHGMPPAVMDRIFEPFFTTREVGNGTGLGLAAIYGIVRQAGGTILTSSVVGQGSRFVVLLPLATPAISARAAASEAAPADRNHETILLAEDDDSVRDLAVRVLQRAKYTVVTAKDGQEAIDVFNADPGSFDLVILDMVMPRVDGRQASRVISARRPDVPILFASGYDPATIAAGKPAEGADNVLSKPYGIPELLGAVRRALDRA